MRRGPTGANGPDDRSQRTARLADGGWVLPWGLGRQVDHGSGAFVPRLAGEGLHNRTGRRWTPVGPVGGPAAAVDPAGLVTPRLGGWSLDWWVGADDRWRLPGREASVRQALVGSAPVVETAMRVPGGDAVHRCFAVPGALVVDVENRSPAPFALAFAVRPLDPLGATAVGTVAVAGDRVLVDGRTALRLPGPPGRVAASTGAQGDVAWVVLEGRAGTTAAPITCADGLASLAAVVPVAHRTTVRVVLPLDGGDGGGGVPDAGTVVRGWQAQARVGLRAELPDPVLQAALEASRLHLLVGAAGDAPAEEIAVAVAALSRLGRHTEADDLVRSLWSRQRTDGSFDEPGSRGAPGGPHLWALGEHLRLRPDAGLASTLERGLVAAEGWIRELAGRGALSPEEARWAAAGRRLGGAAAGESGLAVAASALVAGAAAGAAARAEPAVPEHSAAAVLGLSTPAPLAGSGPAVRGPAGLDVLATLAAAASELAGTDRAVLDRLVWLLGAGGPTWSWPDHVHPHTRAGSDGRGSSPPAVSGLLLVVRDLLVAEPAAGHAALLPVVPDGWLGQPVEVRDAVLAGGVLLSFAVRWHGSRPALLWEASRRLRLTAPGLDPSFAAVEPRGEALLRPVASTTAADDGTVELS